MTSQAAKEVPEGTQLGEYEIRGVLGAGGMGTVYRGVHPIIGKAVAIKVLAPNLSRNEEMVQRFVREARAVVKIQHRYIIDVFAFGHDPSVGHYFVMPLLAGETVGDRVTRDGAYAVMDALHILDQVAEALEVAHEEGIFHRDLKPDNLYLVHERSGPPSVRILDFGIAKLTEGDGTATQTGVQMGTPLFMSPEQWEGRGVDHRTDVYALAIVAHNMLTARYPYETNSHVALMNMHVNGEPKLPSAFGISSKLDEVFAKALAKDKNYRYQGAMEFVTALREAAASGISASQSAKMATADTAYAAPTEASTTAPPQSRKRMALAAGAVGAVGLAAALGLSMAGDDRGGGPSSESNAAAPAEASIPETLDAGLKRVAPPPAFDAAHAVLPAATAPDAGTAKRSVRSKATASKKNTKEKDATDSGSAKPKEAKVPTKTVPREPDSPRTKPEEKTSKWGDTVDPY